jgi:hypothetical protein
MALLGGLLLASFLFFGEIKGESKLYTIVVFIVNILFLTLLAFISIKLGIKDKWWVELFFIPLSTLMSTYICHIVKFFRHNK